jgi:predicted dehydrogenase
MGMIRLGLIGCGAMSRCYIDTFNRLGTRARITACTDIVRSHAEQIAASLGSVTISTDYRDILDEIDAAILVLPHHEHHPVSMACLNAGKHVLCEKPLANSEIQCLEMIAAARKNRCVLMCAYILRYHPMVLKLKDLIDGQQYGPCFHLSLWTEQLTRMPDGHWINDAGLLGGGQLFSHGCHYVDLLLWFLGRPVNGCHIGTNFGTPWMQREGTSDLIIKFESGAIGYHGGTWGARGTRIGFAFHAHCTEGMLEADFLKGRITFFNQYKNEELAVEGSRLPEDKVGVPSVLFEMPEKGKLTAGEIFHFIDCIEQGSTPTTDGPRSLQSLRVIWRMYEAEHKGNVADLRGLGLDQAAD